MFIGDGVDRTTLKTYGSGCVDEGIVNVTPKTCEWIKGLGNELQNHMKLVNKIGGL